MNPAPAKRARRSSFADVLASSVAGSATALVINPFDVVTRRVQAHDFANSRAAVAGLVRHEGIASLFRGLSPTLIMFASTNALYFPLYERVRNTLEDELGVRSSISPLFAGTTARFFSAVLSSPIEYVRTNMQSNRGSLGALGVFRTILHGGPLSLWNGLIPTLWRDVPYSAIYWFMVEHVRLSYGGHDRSQHTFALHFLAGSSSGLVASLITHPFDVMKTHMQRNIGPQVGLLTVGRQLVREWGWMSLYRGLGPRMAKLVPASAVMLSTFEFVRNRMRIEE
jgi:solute carrier family 25, member 39/40